MSCWHNSTNVFFLVLASCRHLTSMVNWLPTHPMQMCPSCRPPSPPLPPRPRHSPLPPEHHYKCHFTFKCIASFCKEIYVQCYPFCCDEVPLWFDSTIVFHIYLYLKVWYPQPVSYYVPGNHQCQIYARFVKLRDNWFAHKQGEENWLCHPTHLLCVHQSLDCSAWTLHNHTSFAQVHKAALA